METGEDRKDSEESVRYELSGEHDLDGLVNSSVRSTDDIRTVRSDQSDCSSARIHHEASPRLVMEFERWSLVVWSLRSMCRIQSRQPLCRFESVELGTLLSGGNVDHPGNRMDSEAESEEIMWHSRMVNGTLEIHRGTKENCRMCSKK